MTTLVVFGDSYAGLSLADLEDKAIGAGHTVDSSLVDPSRTALDWLWSHAHEVRSLAASLPDDTIWYWSIAGIDTLNGRPRWQLRQFIAQLIELAGGQRILHCGYEWWPPGTGVDAQIQPFYEACLDLDGRHGSYRFVELRGAVPWAEVQYVDMLHLSAANYATRVQHLWDTRLEYLLSS